MSLFQFRHFNVEQAKASMKVGTDAMVLGAMIETSNKTMGLDIGAGTGVLSLMVAQNNKHIQIDAVEVDSDSAGECGLNFQNSPWGNRLIIYKKDFLFFKSNKKYDLIFSNPPFFQSRLENVDPRKARARHEKNLPADQLLKKAANLLAENGSFWVIIPFSDAAVWEGLANGLNLHVNKTIAIIGKRTDQAKRLILCFGKEKLSCKSDVIVIRELNNAYSKEYIQLTRNYHNKHL